MRTIGIAGSSARMARKSATPSWPDVVSVVKFMSWRMTETPPCLTRARASAGPGAVSAAIPWTSKNRESPELTAS